MLQLKQQAFEAFKLPVYLELNPDFNTFFEGVMIISGMPMSGKSTFLRQELPKKLAPAYKVILITSTFTLSSLIETIDYIRLGDMPTVFIFDCDDLAQAISYLPYIDRLSENIIRPDKVALVLPDLCRKGNSEMTPLKIDKVQVFQTRYTRENSGVFSLHHVKWYDDTKSDVEFSYPVHTFSLYN